MPHDRIAEFCQRHRIRKLSLFGSALRDDFSPDSDVDMLVEYEEGAAVGRGTVCGLTTTCVYVTCWVHGCVVQAMNDREHFDTDEYLAAVRTIIGQLAPSR